MAKHPVSMDNFSFEPSDLTIAIGDEVEWTNAADPDWHSATHLPANGEPVLFDSPDVFAGDPPFVFKFSDAGEYKYHCRNHGHMIGFVRVTEPVEAK